MPDYSNKLPFMSRKNPGVFTFIRTEKQKWDVRLRGQDSSFLNNHLNSLLKNWRLG
jgi:hypothetical protein